MPTDLERRQANEIEGLRSTQRSLHAALHHWRKAFDSAQREAATRCAEIAGDLSDSYPLAGERAAGAEAAAVAIRRQFGLAPLAGDADALRELGERYVAADQALRTHLANGVEAAHA